MAVNIPQNQGAGDLKQRPMQNGRPSRIPARGGQMPMPQGNTSNQNRSRNQFANTAIKSGLKKAMPYLIAGGFTLGGIGTTLLFLS